MKIYAVELHIHVSSRGTPVSKTGYRVFPISKEYSVIL